MYARVCERQLYWVPKKIKSKIVFFLDTTEISILEIFSLVVHKTLVLVELELWRMLINN